MPAAASDRDRYIDILARRMRTTSQAIGAGYTADDGLAPGEE
jgi:hypothetical protein